MNHLIFLILSVNIIFQLYCSELKNNTIANPMLSRIIVNENNEPTPALLAILKTTDIPHDGTLSTIFTQTQSWLRPTGQERWENHTSSPFTNDNLAQSFENLYLIQEINPLYQHYNYAILLGGTVHDVQNRLACLIRLWNNGIRFDSIIVLASKRSLDPVIENAESLLNNNCSLLPYNQHEQFTDKLPSTETEMIKFVFDRTDTPMKWNTIPRIFIDTPMQKTESGILRRPNTQDTIDEWLKKYNPQSGSILAISNQPFVGYQDAVFRKILPKNFTVETVGNVDSDNEPATIILDALARWIYNEYHIMLQRNN